VLTQSLTSILGGNGKGILRAALLFGAAATLAPTPAIGQGISPTVYYGQPGIPLSVPVIATVGGRCEFATGAAPTGVYNAGQIDVVSWTNDFAFTISCNTASRVAVISANGGLKTAAAATDPGYVGLAPYDVTLNLDGNTTASAATCPVQDLAAGAPTPCSFVGPATSTQGLRLIGPSVNQTESYLRVSAGAYAGPGTLIAGSYTDTLIVSIAAAP
jgi:hypothetical protein